MWPSVATRVKHTLHEGDCIEAMRRMEPGSIDAVVCDPPYSLGFMGKTWDSHSSPRAFQSWCRQWASEALRVLKPGGHLVAFGGTRTHHRLASGIEDAGFEIRDTLAWLYGSGFPKSLDVSKAIDRAAGAEREIVSVIPDRWAGKGNVLQRATQEERAFATVTAPETPEAHAWQGWGTALKPAYEPIILARKPLSGTVAENVLSHGVGAINIDACRIGTDGGTRGIGEPDYLNNVYGRGMGGLKHDPSFDGGRWPANVMLDEEAAALLDEQTGVTKSSARVRNNQASSGESGIYGLRAPVDTNGHDDSGGASRFFYTSKASTRQRNAGLHALGERDVHRYGAGIGEGHAPEAPVREGNYHPTVKPLDVMRWLCRLVTPPGGVVLDPFTGSGTTGMAAIAEGLAFVGCEMDPEFLKIADTRIREAYVLAPT